MPFKTIQNLAQPTFPLSSTSPLLLNTQRALYVLIPTFLPHSRGKKQTHILGEKNKHTKYTSFMSFLKLNSQPFVKQKQNSLSPPSYHLLSHSFHSGAFGNWPHLNLSPTPAILLLSHHYTKLHSHRSPMTTLALSSFVIYHQSKTLLLRLTTSFFSGP